MGENPSPLGEDFSIFLARRRLRVVLAAAAELLTKTLNVKSSVPMNIDYSHYREMTISQPYHVDNTLGNIVTVS